MKTPVLSVILLVFILWLNYEIHKSSKSTDNGKDSFWQREAESNASRKADISALNYIIVTTERLPMADDPDQTVNSYRDTILKLSGKKILNLGGITNTELKLKYGVANINQLTEYDNNYTTLVSILQKWAKRLYDLGNLSACEAVLEYAVSCLTDVTQSYTLLATTYMRKNTPEKIDDLVTVIPKTKIPDPVKLRDEIIWIKNS